MDPFINKITALALALGAIFGYIVKLRWSREFEKTMEARVAVAQEAAKAAQDGTKAAQEATKAAQEAAKDLSPTNVAERFRKLKEFYEMEAAHLNVLLKRATDEKEKKEKELEEFQKAAGSEKALRELLARENASYEKEIDYLRRQIAELKNGGRILEEASELIEKEPYQRNRIEKELLLIRGGRDLGRARYESAQKGTYRSVAAAMNARAEAAAQAEAQEKKVAAHRAPLDHSDDYGR